MVKDPRIETWSFKKYQDPAILICSGLLILAGLGAIINPTLISFLVLFAAILVWGIILYFFRDPSREVIKEMGLVVSPCDGEVVSIETLEEKTYLEAKTLRISVFLSLFDVHVQRIPLAGKVSLVEHKPGKYLQAFRREASDVNEYIAMVIESDYGNILVKQIAGILARRCINYAHRGDEVETGQRFGHIKFGSRVDLFLPRSAEIKIKVGDKIYGGLTPVAKLNDDDE
jgi:phosphatidylserine decarboxylase